MNEPFKTSADLPVSIAMRLFDATPASLIRLRGGNFSGVYAFTRQGKEYVLRLTPPNPEIDRRSLLSSLAVMDHLARGGVSVPAPLRSTNGAWVEELPTPQGAVLACAFEKAPGILGEELPFSAWDARRFALLGRVVGRMHACLRDYSPPAPELARPDWDQVGNCFHPTQEPQGDRIIRRRAEALAAVMALPRGPDGFGLIHTDLHGGNFLLDPPNERMTLLDFDDCSYGWYAMDIAMCLHDFCVLSDDRDKDAFGASFLLAFLRGYLPEFPLDPLWVERLPLFLKLLETGLYCQVAPLYDPREPEGWVGRFMAQRKDRIEAGRPVLAIDFAGIAHKAVLESQNS
jgi:amicoumacin kinase